MSIYVVRAFVNLRAVLATHSELGKRIDELESRLDNRLIGHDKAIAAILTAIRQLMAPSAPKKSGIGFTADIEASK